MALGFNHWFKVAAALKPACTEAVRDEVFFCADAIKGVITANGQVSAPVEGYAGGFMRDSVYASAAGESTYGQGIEPPKGAYRLPEQKPENDMQGVVGCAASYGIYQDMGTRFMPARPFFEPGIEQGNAQYDVYMARIAKRLEEAAL